jgi:hypothetical protein
MAKDIYDSFIDIVSGMRNFKSYAGKKFQLVDFNNEQITVHDVKKDEDIELSFDDIMNGLSYDDGERTAANLKECMPAKQASALAAIFYTIGYEEDISYYRFMMGDD